MNKKRELAPIVIPPKPPKHEISDAEFRHRLKQKTSEWRKERLELVLRGVGKSEHRAVIRAESEV